MTKWCLTIFTWEEPVVIGKIHPLLVFQEAVDICPGQLDRTIRAVILRRMKLAAIHRAGQGQLIAFNVHVRELEGESLIGTGGRNRVEPYHRAVWVIET